MNKRFFRTFMTTVALINAVAFNLAMQPIAEQSNDTQITKDEDIVVVRSLTEEEVAEQMEANLVQYSYKLAEEYFEEQDALKKTDKSYVIQSGDTLWGIAEDFYGDGSYYPLILKNNDIKENQVWPGKEIMLYYIEDPNGIVLEECYEYTRQHRPKKEQKKPNHSKTKASGKARNGIIPDGNLEFIGNFDITAYDAYCVHCCGKSNGITASGTHATVGRTIAVKGIPFGTRLYIEGYGTYTVEDRGGLRSNLIDIVASNHEECYTLTGRNVPVYKVN